MTRAEKDEGAGAAGVPPQAVEAALERLEAIADRLEDPALELDAAVRLYEEGLRLYGECAARLDAADLRITQLAAALAEQEPGGRPAGD